MGEDVEEVVSGAVDGGGARRGEGVGEGFVERHLGGAGEGAFVVVVAEDGGVGDFVLGEEGGDFEEGLRGS